MPDARWWRHRRPGAGADDTTTVRWRPAPGRWMRPPGGEPVTYRWQVVRIADLGLPRFVAVDGRSASGKSTVAARVAASVAGAAMVHTDDVAWHHDFFDWADLLADGVLRPARAGAAVAYRPPAWDARDRPGAVTVPAGAPLVLVEGVGVGRRSLAPLFDALVWVETDPALARVRGLARDGDDPASVAFWDEWDAREVTLLAHERPWERADLIVAGAPALPHDPASELVVAA